jgi:hypothetical protein
MGKSSQPEYSEAQIERVETCGQCQMSILETAVLCGITEAELRQGVLFGKWTKGRLEAELAVRRSLLQKAQDGDGAAMKEFMRISDLQKASAANEFE